MTRIVVHNYIPGPYKTRDTAEALAKLPALKKAKFLELLDQAGLKDVMSYLPGLTRLAVLTDTDKWNACYVPSDDEILIQSKLLDKPINTQLEVLMHEIGHRGQQVDPKTYKLYRKSGEATLRNFLAMANDVHQEDYKKNGIGAAEMVDEIFAESYSRFVLGRVIPEGLKAFWRGRLGKAQGTT
jgi:hypothetical protein